MKKKISLLLAAAITAIAITGCGGGTTTDPGTTGSTDGASEPLELIVAHNQTSAENPYAYGMNAFKEAVERNSNGQITVTVHNGTLGENESDLIEKLQMGGVDMVVASPGFMTSIGVPEVDMFSLLYLFDDFDHWAAAVDGEFGDSMKQIINEKTGNDFRVMSYWSSSVRDVYAKQPITTPADAAGLKIRTQSSQVQQEFWKQCGAIPTSVAWGELYQALQQGVVDGAENDYTNLMLKEHHKTDNGKYISETNHDYTTRLLLMNGNFYDSLTDEQKKWIDDAVVEATEVERQVTLEKMEESKAKVIADGAIVTEAEDVDIDAFKEIAIPIQDEFAAENNMTEQLEMVRSLAE